MEAVIIGYSGHSLVVVDILSALEYDIIGYCEFQRKEIDPFKLVYLGDETDASVINLIKHKSVFLGIGDNSLRAKVFSFLVNNNINFPSAVHPNAFLSKKVMLGDGSIVMPGALINAFATIGRATICNTGCVIEHECQIGDFVHIAPGAVLAGNVTVHNGTFVGANAVIKQGVRIGKNVTIGAGAVVTQDVEDGLIVYGNPAKKR